ncbi:lipase 3-like [Maniola jurtina]|uniref:lipase 3-like n=1 Tax=Maniola jurtina TaxID=191418 RepID=UPI001E68A15B|nr:lipase 3-like [Maniola jurtina]
MRDGYYSETHDVITSDGYILEINRIPNSRYKKGPIKPKSKPVVFLMHGLQASAISYIFAGPNISLAYQLADAGYDVWMGNSRGTVNSRRHIRLNPDDRRDKKEFFDYTFEDIAVKDLPTMIDYVLEVTKQPQLNYVGHSQGGTNFLVLNSLLPEYNRKFKSAHLLAGVGYQRHFPNIVLGGAAITTDLIHAFAVQIGMIEIFGPSANAEVHCDESNKLSVECTLEQVKDTMLQIFGDFDIIAGASIKQYAHYGQNIRDRSFRRWNYYPMRNLMVYGSVAPPRYDLSLITADVTMHYTVGDVLLHERDVLSMAADMPNAKVRRVARSDFSHTDFVSAADAREQVLDYVVKRINEENKKK